jgi:hypothetical protein
VSEPADADVLVEPSVPERARPHPAADCPGSRPRPAEETR